MQIFPGSDGLVRSSPPSRWTGNKEEEDDRRIGKEGKRGEGEEGEPERDLASPDLISRVQSRPPRQSRRSPGKHKSNVYN